MGRKRNDDPDAMFDERGDDDEPVEYPSQSARSVADGRFEPSYAKCEHCDENGMIVTGHNAPVTNRYGRVVAAKQTADCWHCDGIGYLDVPTGEDTKQHCITTGNTSDLTVLMRARYCRGERLWQGPQSRAIRTNRHEMSVIVDDDEG